MTYKEFPPPPALSHMVRSFWILEGTNLPTDNFVVRLMPFSCPRFVFHYKNHFYHRLKNQIGRIVPDSVLNGHSNRFQEYLVNGDFGFVGVYLYPYAPACLFQLDAKDYFNQVLSLKSIINSAALGLLEEQIFHASDNESRINLMTLFLLDQLKLNVRKPELHNDIIKHMVNNGCTDSINNLTEKHGLSVKQLERKFISSIGLTPKSFSRIVRFQRAIKQIQNSQSLTILALDQGYYDQSHFNHEFKHFSGFSPSSFYKDGGRLMADLVCGLIQDD